MEERWWTYDRAGRVRRIIDRWPGEDGETFQTTRLDYTGAGQLWLVRRFTTEYNLLGESWNEPVMQQIREFRYSGVGKARYWVRERDPDAANHPVLLQSWHEYDGEEIAKDLEWRVSDPCQPEITGWKPVPS